MCACVQTQNKETLQSYQTPRKKFRPRKKRGLNKIKLLLSSLSLAELFHNLDDYHNVHAKKVPAQLVTSRAIHMASCLMDIQQILAVLQPPNVSIHRPVNVTGNELTCYGGIDEQVIRNKMQQALVNIGKTFMTQLPPAMLKLDPKKLKESLRQLRQVYPVNYKRGQND